MSAFNAEQTNQLLKPISPLRVLADGKGHSHVSQQDVLAHLIRVFGFGAFDIEVLNAECVFEESAMRRKRNKQGEEYGDPYLAWDVCYRAMVRLTIRDEHGTEVAHYENGSTATAQHQPSRGDAHDLAYKSAISLSVKRAAIALGDQFGLSLYNKGQTKPLVIASLVLPSEPPPESDKDMQAGVAQQVAMGNDEIDREATA